MLCERTDFNLKIIILLLIATHSCPPIVPRAFVGNNVEALFCQLVSTQIKFRKIDEQDEEN